MGHPDQASAIVIPIVLAEASVFNSTLAEEFAAVQVILYRVALLVLSSL